MEGDEFGEFKFLDIYYFGKGRKRKDKLCLCVG